MLSTEFCSKFFAFLHLHLSVNLNVNKVAYFVYAAD